MDEFPCCAIYSSFLRRLRFEPECTFAEGRPVFVARAPGRLDALGGVVDYSGGTVAEMPLAVAVTAALQPRADRTLRLVSLGGADDIVALDNDEKLVSKIVELGNKHVTMERASAD